MFSRFDETQACDRQTDRQGTIAIPRKRRPTRVGRQYWPKCLHFYAVIDDSLSLT